MHTRAKLVPFVGEYQLDRLLSVLHKLSALLMGESVDIMLPDTGWRSSKKGKNERTEGSKSNDETFLSESVLKR